MKILVVEDSPQVAETVMDYLELAGHRVDCAYHGQAALQLLAEQRFDVIIMDVMMPRLDGLRTVERLRSDGIATPVLFLTARDSLDDKLAGFKAGATTTWSSRSPWRSLRCGCRPWPCAAPAATWGVGVRRPGGGSAAGRATRAGVELKLGKIPFQILTLLVKRAPIW